MNQLRVFRSKDRISSSAGSHDFVLKLEGNSLEGDYILQYALIPNTVYTVRSGINDVIYFNENSTNKSATITAGFYTETTLPAAVKTALDTASASYNTFTVSISSVTKKMTLSASNNFSILGASALCTAGRLIGFTSNSAAASSATSNNVVNLSEPLSICARIEEASPSFVCDNGAYGSFIIPLDAGYGYFKYYKTDDFSQKMVFNGKKNKITVKLYDLDGAPINLNGTDFEFGLLKI